MKKFTIKDDYFIKGTIKGNLVYLISANGDITIYDMKTKESRILGNYMKIIGHGHPQGFTVLDDGKIVAFTENKLFVIGLDGVLNQTVLRYNESPCILGNYFYQKQNTETGQEIRIISLDDFSLVSSVDLGADQTFSIDTVTDEIYIFSHEERTYQVNGNNEEYSLGIDISEESNIVVSNGNIAVFTPTLDALSVVSSGRDNEYSKTFVPDSDYWISRQFITV
jgi:hypothetical protein